MTNEFVSVVINKNRGWRGLAEVVVRNKEYKEVIKNIFSFSQPVWDDLIKHERVVIQDENYYYILEVDGAGKLPRPEQQRSVLIKNFDSVIQSVNVYPKATWREEVTSSDWNYIVHFLKNKNNHTTSDWNCIGIRVVPEI